MTDKHTHKRGAVMCIETGKVYPSAYAAADAIGRTRCAMANHLAGRAPHIKGLHFVHVDAPRMVNRKKPIISTT